MVSDPEILAVGFRLGLVERDEIISWADSRILEMSQPPAELIDLALMSDSHAQDILGKLGELSNEVSPLAALPAAFFRYTHRLRDRPELGPEVANGLWSLAVEANYDVPEELSPIFGFDEDYWLAMSGTFGKESDVHASLLSFCETIALDA